MLSDENQCFPVSASVKLRNRTRSLCEAFRGLSNISRLRGRKYPYAGVSRACGLRWEEGKD